MSHGKLISKKYPNNLNNRYNRLKNKISKTFKSLKYTIINNDLTEEYRTTYINKIHAGIMRLFEEDTITFIDKIKQPLNINIVIAGVNFGSADITLFDLCFKEVDLDTLYPKHITHDIKEYICTFVRDIIDNPTVPNTGTYVVEILTLYLSLTPTRSAEITDGKLTIY